MSTALGRSATSRFSLYTLATAGAGLLLACSGVVLSFNAHRFAEIVRKQLEVKMVPVSVAWTLPYVALKNLRLSTEESNADGIAAFPIKVPDVTSVAVETKTRTSPFWRKPKALSHVVRMPDSSDGVNIQIEPTADIHFDDEELSFDGLALVEVLLGWVELPRIAAVKKVAYLSAKKPIKKAKSAAANRSRRTIDVAVQNKAEQEQPFIPSALIALSSIPKQHSLVAYEDVIEPEKREGTERSPAAPTTSGESNRMETRDLDTQHQSGQGEVAPSQLDIQNDNDRQFPPAVEPRHGASSNVVPSNEKVAEDTKPGLHPELYNETSTQVEISTALNIQSVGLQKIVQMTAPGNGLNTQSNQQASNPPAYVHAPEVRKKKDQKKPQKKPQETQAAGVRSTSQQEQAQFRGKVVDAFTGGAVASQDATIQVLGTDWSVVSDQSGEFAFDDIEVKGLLPVVVRKSGYLPRRIDLKPGTIPTIELVSQNALQMTSRIIGESAKDSTGILFGQFTDPFGTVDFAGLRVEVQGPMTGSVVYLDAFGKPDPALKASSSRSQFVVMNLIPGTYLVSVIDAAGIERAPHLVTVGEGEGVVRKFNLGKLTTIRGTIKNAFAVNASVDDAEVQMLGSLLKARTDRHGNFELHGVYVDCYDQNYIQMDKSGFYRNRFEYSCTDTGEAQTYYAVSAASVDAFSVETHESLNPSSGFIVGHVNMAKPVRAQLWGVNEYAPSPQGVRGRDFYFDADGIINPSRNKTSKTENFIIANTPEGGSYLQVFDKEQRILGNWPIYTSPSVVNIVTQH